jgi:hypothetical protein
MSEEDDFQVVPQSRSDRTAIKKARSAKYKKIIAQMNLKEAQDVDADVLVRRFDLRLDELDYSRAVGTFASLLDAEQKELFDKLCTWGGAHRAEYESICDDLVASNRRLVAAAVRVAQKAAAP